MSEQTITVEWPEGPLGALLLLLVLLLIVFDLGRSASERFTVAVGSIRLRPPALVPLADEEADTAAHLIGGAMMDYFAQSDQEPSP